MRYEKALGMERRLGELLRLPRGYAIRAVRHLCHWSYERISEPAIAPGAGG